LAAAAAALASCGAKKKLQQAGNRYSSLDSAYRALQSDLAACKDSAEAYKRQIGSLRKNLSEKQESNNRMVEQLKDLSVISSSQAESINKSLENISGKDAYIRDLQSAIARKDSLTMNLVMNLKGAIGNLDDEDIDIKVDKGVVYIDISDKLLFESGDYKLTGRAPEVLGKVAKVLAAQPHIEFMVEGHTDNVPYRSGVLLDNWDLSVKRATTIVRVLQTEYGIPPARMTAAGRSEYIPVESNDAESGRAANRRTRIVILPELDQFFKLLERS
ncbi:MAG TPA: OmpA family protein, partial [Anseongella sp.]|nr:OmpA family protein [Anseongella sp.]